MKIIDFKNFVLPFVLSMSLVGASTQAAFELPPVLATEQEKANFLGHIANEIPWLFMEGAEYDVNFLQLINNQNLVVQALMQDKKYLREIEKRKELVELTVEVEADGIVKERTATKALKTAIATASKTDLDSFVELISTLYLEFGTKNYRSIATGLISSLPGEQKGKLFKMSPEEQIEALSKLPNLTDDFIRAKFRPEVVGLKASELSRNLLFEYMKRGQEIEMELVASIIAYQLKTHEIPISGLKKVLSDFSWITELNWKGVKPEELKKLFSTAIKNYVETEDVTARVPSGKFTIREVPPYLGMFRGIVGADCATQYSATIVYADRERTFFIYDDAGNLKGYATATNVKGDNGKKYLYLHDVTGARLSVQMMKDVFHAISENISAFGAQGVLIPNKDQIHRNNNYIPLRTWQQSLLTRAATAIEMTYPDAETRQTIFTTGTSNADYDSPEVNPDGYLLVLPKEESPRYYKAKAKEIVAPLKLPNLSKKEVVFLMLALSYGNYSRDAIDSLNQATAVADQGHASSFKQRVAAAQQIAKAWGFNANTVVNLAYALTNPEMKPTKEFYKAIGEGFKSLGVDLTEADIAKNQYLFYQGHVQASDATKTADNSKKTLAASMWLLKRWPTPSSVHAAYASNPNLFLESTAFTNYVAGLVSEQAPQLRQLRWLIQTVGVDAIILENKGAELERLQSNRDAEINQEAGVILQYLKQAEKNQGVKCAI